MTKTLIHVRSIVCGAMIFLGLAMTASAADAPVTNKWISSVSAGVTLTSGTKDSFLAAIAAATARKTTRDEIKLGAGAAYGTTTFEQADPTPTDPGHTKNVTETTTAFASGFGQYNYLFSEKFYAGLRLDALHDDISDIQYRFTLSPLAGYYLIKNTNTQFYVEAGPSVVIERQGDVNDTYAALRLAERYERKISDVAKVWEAVEYVPQVDDFQNYILNMEVGLEAAINKTLSLRVVFTDQYDNVPAPGSDKNEIKLFSSLVYKF